jgi:poly-gamma-glutamate capsule biosynthesis protein CapA/YwtB (metallophosphatase superfamily)
MALCLFCDSGLNEASTPEHILHNALRGRKTTRHAICSAHNNAFGETIDDALASQVIAIRNLLQLKSRWAS